MSPADDPIAMLRTLSAADRRAVLGRLSPAERLRVAAAERVPAEPAFAADIADRIVDSDAPMTPAGRAALLAAAGALPAPAMPGAGPSLVTRLRHAIGLR
jgi:hypothetical protein